MKMVLLSPAVKRIYDFLEANTAECSLNDVFPELPVYYEEQDLCDDSSDKEPAAHNFLSDLILTNLKLPEAPDEDNIAFTAELNTAPGFLSGSLCYEAIKDIRTIQCSMTENDIGEIVFAGTYLEVAGETAFSNLHLSVSGFVFSSGTTAETVFAPKFSYNCRLGQADNGLPFAVGQPAGSKQIVLRGDSDTSGERSIKDILQMFCLGDIPFADCLPAEINTGIFDHLMLQNVLFEAAGNQIHSFSFGVTANTPLDLLDGKISFTPGFQISIDYFDEAYSVNFYAYGQIKIGGTSYSIYMNPGLNEISFAMNEGDILDLAAVSKSFFDIEFPMLQFDKLSASLNYRNNTYMFGLQTAELLTFSAASKEISIEHVMLQVWYASSQFAVSLKGNFNICGFSFELAGSYTSGGNYSLSACITDDIHIKVTDLLVDFFGSSCLMGDSFNFDISQLIFRCSMGQASSFAFDIRGCFCGNDDTLKKLFAVTTDIHVTANKKEGKWYYGFDISCMAEIGGDQTLSCRYVYDNSAENKNVITVAYSPKTSEGTVTLADILDAAGFSDIDSSWSFITQTGISKAELKYDFQNKILSGEITISSGGTFQISVTFGVKTDYRIVMSSTTVISLTDIPIAGGLVNHFLFSKDAFSVKNITVYALSAPDQAVAVPAGVRLDFTVFGEKQQWQIYEIKPAVRRLGADKNSPPKVFWVKLEKTIKIFTLHRIGLGLDGSYLMLALDASLNVSPLTFRLLGAGIGVNLSDFDLKYYISGFGVSFKNEALEISGEFNKNGIKYAGMLLIQIKQISVFAIAEYSEDGCLFAYAVVSARIGGPPAFFIMGLALGFGYNKRIAMPAIDKVADYPLVKGAMGKIGPEGMLADLDNYITDESGQKFITAGIRFNTFEIAESFVLMTVSFGNNFEIDLLGISDMTMPPHCPESVAPIAHAQLALKASFKPSEGFVGIEARLTSESYILSKDCHLTGGFAFYMWFAKEHSGDFVITLGGYHPKYAVKKPAHYPDVPRVGFTWNIKDYINICGEMYFALTPSTLMAGGRLSVTYALGSLKAYFIARADFLIDWKPFHYDIVAGITVGASYRVKTWFVSFTLSVELGTDLHIWGPDFTGTAHLSFWIISFDVAFGADAPQKAEDLEWADFCRSFLPKADASEDSSLRSVNVKDDPVPLTISFNEGLNGQVTIVGKAIKSVRPGGITLTADSVIPVKTVNVNNRDVAVTPVNTRVKPMGKKGSCLSSGLTVTVTDESGGLSGFSGTVITKSMPAALWGGEGELLENVPCGVLLNACGQHKNEQIFPEKQFISLDDLYSKGATVIANAFVYMNPTDLPSYTDNGSIVVFSSTVNSETVSSVRESFLNSLGVTLSGKITLEKYAAQADSYLNEEVLIPVK